MSETTSKTTRAGDQKRVGLAPSRATMLLPFPIFPESCTRLGDVLRTDSRPVALLLLNPRFQITVVVRRMYKYDASFVSQHVLRLRALCTRKTSYMWLVQVGAALKTREEQWAFPDLIRLRF